MAVFLNYANPAHGRTVRYRHEDAARNRHLELPDGRLASRVRRNELYKALRRLGVPGINGSIGSIELLDAYRAKLESVRDELYPREAGGHLSQSMMRAAAEFLDKMAKDK